MNKTTFRGSSIYFALNIEEDNAYVANQAFEFFRNRLIKKPKENDWFELEGSYSDPPQIDCVNEGNKVELKKVATSRANAGNGGAKLIIGDKEFWFAQCLCGAIYFAHKV